MLGSSWDDPRTLATLAAAQQLLSGSGSSIQRIADAGMSYGGTLEQRKSVEIERQRRMAETLLMQQRVAQLAQAQKDAEAQAQAQARDEGLMTRLLGMPVEQQMPAGVEGPGAPMQNTGIDPRTFLNQGGSLGALPKVGALNQFMATPSVERKIVGNPKDGLWDITDPDSPRQIVAPTEKPNMNELIIPDGKGGYTINQPLLDAKREIARSGATNIGLPKIEVKTGESLAGQVGPMVRETRDGAIAGLKLVDSAGRILDAAKRGGLFAGPAANLLLRGAQVADVLGIAGKDTKEKIANTRTVVRGMAEQAVAARSQLGGQAQISNTEQELLTKATSGDIADLTAAEIVQIAKLNDRLGRQLYARHERTLETMKGRPELSNVMDFYQVPPLPQAMNFNTAPSTPQQDIEEADRILNRGK